MTDAGDAELTKEIRERVAAHYASSEDALLLSKLGQSVARRPAHGASFAETVRQALEDEYEIISDPKHLPIKAIVPRSKVAEYRARLEERPTAGAPLADFPRVLLIAFCRAVPAGQRVFFRTEPPYRYDVAASPPSSDHVEIEPEFMVQGHFVRNPLQLPSETKRLLAQNITAWLSRHQITLKATPRVTAVASASALERLIDAQPSDVRARLLIPGDIAALLAKH